MCNDLCEKCGIGIEEAPRGCIRIGCPLKCKTAVQGWISVKKRLPKLGESVGYTYDGKEIRNDVYYPGYNGSWESENSLGFYINEKEITHWMKLPEPPK